MRRLILAGLVLAAAGCGKAEEVRRYKAPKDPLWRMVAAIASGKDQTWYFKAVGSDRLVGEYQDKLLSFLKGLRLEDGAVRWTLPPDVKEVPGQGDRQATLRFGAREPFLDVTVVTLAGTGGGTLANVNRWRGQMGLGAIGEADLPAHTRTISAQGLDVLALDLTSPRRPGVGMAAAAPPPQETGRDDLRSLFAFDTPPGWKENPHPGPGRIFELHTDGGAVVTFSHLKGDAGGLVPNVNRWRGQVGLSPLGEDEARASVLPAQLLTRPGGTVEMTGRDVSLVVTFMISEQFSFFLKIMGPPQAVAAQRAAFDAFARSLRLGERHE